MATGTIILPVQAPKISGTFIALPARIDAGNPAWRLLFSASQTELALFMFRMPQNFASGLIAKLIFTMASAVANKVVLGVEIMALSDGESDPDVANFDTINKAPGGTTVPDTAGKTKLVSITCANADNVAAGDLVLVRVSRDHDDANDTAVGDLELRAFSLEYTTT